MDTIIQRQQYIAKGEAEKLELPAFSSYSVCNLRGGIGKTSIAFNLAYLANNVLAVDTCPQCSLSSFFDSSYDSGRFLNVLDLIEPYLYPNMGKPSHIARNIGATNKCFEEKKAYYIGSSERLYVIPMILGQALIMAGNRNYRSIADAQKVIVTSLKTELDREQTELGINRRIIDTSPFFSGGTMLSWFASEALIVPVRTDRQSINSLKLLIQTLQAPDSDFNKYKGDINIPKIQAIVLTHCGWSTSAGARNVPNNQTRLYLQEIYDIVNRHISLFSTDCPSNHIFMLDDFLGCGRISSALAKPIELLSAGETHTINRVKTEVNASVAKIQHELKFLSDHLWSD